MFATVSGVGPLSPVLSSGIIRNFSIPSLNSVMMTSLASSLFFRLYEFFKSRIHGF